MNVTLYNELEKSEEKLLLEFPLECERRMPSARKVSFGRKRRPETQKKAKPRRDNSARNTTEPSASVFKHACHVTSIDENFALMIHASGHICEDNKIAAKRSQYKRVRDESFLLDRRPQP